LTGLGYLFGNTGWVKEHFEWVALGMIIIPGLPAVFEVVRQWLRARARKAERKAEQKEAQKEEQKEAEKKLISG
ncbi:MAG: hypothetical protein AB7S98_12505, partial [Burkholderiaceae bacterium]